MESKIQKFDYVVLGGGIYGLYASDILLKKGYRVALIECDKDLFGRASSLNQARLHLGYHYPRSISTARASARYFRRFIEEFDFAINNRFKKIYAISSRNSYTSKRQFLKFCSAVNIPAFEIDAKEYFNEGSVEVALQTEEYSFDAKHIKNELLERIKYDKNMNIFVNKRLSGVEKKEDS